MAFLNQIIDDFFLPNSGTAQSSGDLRNTPACANPGNSISRLHRPIVCKCILCTDKTTNCSEVHYNRDLLSWPQKTHVVGVGYTNPRELEPATTTRPPYSSSPCVAHKTYLPSQLANNTDGRLVTSNIGWTKRLKRGTVTRENSLNGLFGAFYKQNSPCRNQDLFAVTPNATARSGAAIHKSFGKSITLKRPCVPVMSDNLSQATVWHSQAAAFAPPPRLHLHPTPYHQLYPSEPHPPQPAALTSPSPALAGEASNLTEPPGMEDSKIQRAEESDRSDLS
ncbi:unnamed protein product [Protopolystoma xenopodis]|uniref:Uncharacterized protein n=1 Tax=Protopolystoma xenopodis TaxID=117903 RepID=A0A448WB05_9PLAT|nr:unnamed protein product [Protopolystoma xenopodis]